MHTFKFRVTVVLCFCYHYSTANSLDGSKFVRNKIEQHPSKVFKHHSIIEPRIICYDRKKREISATKNMSSPNENLTMTFRIDGEEVILDLTLNKDLIYKDLFVRTQQKNTFEMHRSTAKEDDLCHYHGQIRDRNNSMVALSTCNGVTGVIIDAEETYYIENNITTNKNSSYFLYKNSDLMKFPKRSQPQEHTKTKNKSKRSAEDFKRIKAPYNVNEESRFIELALVIDNSAYQDFNWDTNQVESYCKSLINIVNMLYTPLNIFIALVGIDIWTDSDKISISRNQTITLKNFLEFRKSELSKIIPNDNAHLLTRIPFEKNYNKKYDKAFMSQICTDSQSGGVETISSEVKGLIAVTIAHEIGHNLGMKHDKYGYCDCVDKQCIMAPSPSSGMRHWSNCSLHYLQITQSKGLDYCLRNKPKSLFGDPTCGNGFVEIGEECDCGLPENCKNKCCNPYTCKLQSNAICAQGECCDFTTCELKSATTLCRSAKDDCDLAEYCTEQSEYCPSDAYKMDTEACDNGKAFCYKGSCRSRGSQCKLLWGPSGHPSPLGCYDINLNGDYSGHCGGLFSPCVEEDKFCGVLQCSTLNYTLNYERNYIVNHSIAASDGGHILCTGVTVDGLDANNPGMTPDGVACGKDMMCLNHKCISMLSFKTQLNICNKKCEGNGVCNHLGECQCRAGFVPPYCKNADPANALDNIGMFYIYIGIGVALLIAVLAAMIVCFCFCRRKKPKNAPTIISNNEIIYENVMSYKLSSIFPFKSGRK